MAGLTMTMREEVRPALLQVYEFDDDGNAKPTDEWVKAFVHTLHTSKDGDFIGDFIVEYEDGTCGTGGNPLSRQQGPLRTVLLGGGVMAEFRWHDATKELPELGKADYLVIGINGGLYLCPRFEGYDDDHVWFRDTRGSHHEPIKVKAWAEIPPYREASG